MTKNITKYLKETDNRYYSGKALGDCSDLPEGYRSGIYKIQPTKSDEFDVYCQMVDYGEGWTVIQRRESCDLDFFLGWTKYKEGFGRLDQEFWLGTLFVHLKNPTKQLGVISGGPEGKADPAPHVAPVVAYVITNPVTMIFTH